jgi:hypothetical protein
MGLEVAHIKGLLWETSGRLGSRSKAQHSQVRCPSAFSYILKTAEYFQALSFGIVALVTINHFAGSKPVTFALKLEFNQLREAL